MKEINASIAKTTAWMKRDFRMFDFAFYCQQIISGIKNDLHTCAEIEGEWLHAQDSKGRFHEVNIYRKFTAI